MEGCSRICQGRLAWGDRDGLLAGTWHGARTSGPGVRAARLGLRQLPGGMEAWLPQPGLGKGEPSLPWGWGAGGNRGQSTQCIHLVHPQLPPISSDVSAILPGMPLLQVGTFLCPPSAPLVERGEAGLPWHRRLH